MDNGQTHSSVATSVLNNGLVALSPPSSLKSRAQRQKKGEADENEGRLHIVYIASGGKARRDNLHGEHTCLGTLLVRMDRK